ncbi:threonine--tRNA ligase [Deferribacterales bacterium Es71-Z0220]|jgi:threonyl-tRNA synthetase|uniref:threonine--tRNA ligase n=1 Tax=Deferrivibrio essentukiensis TaxID=2880922 RepID=UPI001F6083E5|nr:threonine--tRNA ligase [Deferrivibrio essentukiensis]MBZ4672897.1 threonyl-tRNA synthetase [Deferribacteraceae bacterium]MCB4204731.1 threonine--tRNA ligase [Deferrivibrio essentukiensis]
MNIYLPDGNVFELMEEATVIDLAKKISNGLAKVAIAGEVNGKLVDLYHNLKDGDKVRIVTNKDKEALDILRHSTAHLMAQAVKRLFPEAKVTIGPNIEDGFYYDFDIERPFTPEDLEKIEKEMKKISDENIQIRRKVLSKDEAVKLFSSMGETFKVEIINELEEGEVSLYEQGDFVDLCRGPHLPSTGKIKFFKLLNVAGAYWRGDENNKMLQRIYGTAWFKKEDLDDYLNRLEEAKKRDHRKLGKELELFSTFDEIGSGLICWMPKGGRMRATIEDFWRKKHYENGYELLYTPHIGKSNLWQTSGHLDFYNENMYSPMDIEGQNYFIKPMNCPFHIMIYKSKTRSYRDLPLRWAELGTVYRYERSGVLHGLLRVRGFTQDDAHIVCAQDQIESEIKEVLRFSLEMWKAFGFENIKGYIATRPEKSVGDESMWEKATNSLTEAIKSSGIEFEVDEGGGAFYGPKIDLKVKDAIGREWQMTTIQFDFNLPERFDMSYVDKDGQQKRPFMVHRALLGSLERFFGVLIEHFAGAFPMWIAPVQVKILNISDTQIDYCKELYNELKSNGFRVELDLRNEKIGYKIREAQMEKIPHMIIIGNDEMENKKVSVRLRNGENKNNLDFSEYIGVLRELDKSKTQQLWR